MALANCKKPTRRCPLARRALFASILPLAAGVAYGAENPVVASTETEGFRIVIDPGLMDIQNDAERGQALEAWLRSAATRAQQYEALAARGRKNKAVEDYEIELAARTALATAWAASRAASDAAANAYLDKLLEIQQAGFMEEYVLYFFTQPGWTLSPASLAQIDFDAFAQWGNANLGAFAPQTTLVTLESSMDDRPQVSAQPGASLPDPAQYAPTAASCAASIDALFAASQQWSEESAQVDAAPIAAADRNEFIYVLNNTRGAEPFRSQGITWVSDRPGRLAYLAGFCAVEDDNYLDARWWLDIAAALRPMDAGVQTELVHVLTFMRQFAEADAVIDRVIVTAQDPCELAGIWRRRGYIRFEQGEMEEARSAYLESLKYHPGEQLALAELQLIDRIMLENDQVGEAPALPPSGTRLQVCQRGQ